MPSPTGVDNTTPFHFCKSETVAARKSERGREACIRQRKGGKEKETKKKRKKREGVRYFNIQQ